MSTPQSALTSKVWGRVIQRHPKRLSIVKALKIIGLPPERVSPKPGPHSLRHCLGP
jgi:hypothetical protein